MCGIVGYVGPRQASDVLLAGLAQLEYRGYDSAGVAIINDGVLTICKREGELANLRESINLEAVPGHLGIGHTRWATHGKPIERNAHPHADCAGKIAVVHNGIIENYADLREELSKEGHEFTSETDTGAIPHLIEKYYEGDLLQAVAKAVNRLEGAYALAIVHSDYPDAMVAVRKDSPLIIGKGQGENIIASDVPALLEYTRDIVALRDDEIAFVTKDDVVVYNAELEVVEPELRHIDWDLETAQKGGFDHFMTKEIYEQPAAIRETLRGRFYDGRVQLDELGMSPEDIKGLNKVFIVACGSSYNAGLLGKRLIESWAKIPVEIDVASEFIYNDPFVDEKTLVIAITQSGETADTLSAVKKARAAGAKTIAITNVLGSTVTRQSDGVIYTRAGIEISVAATKSFTTQLTALNILALKLAQETGGLSLKEVQDIYAELSTLPEIVEEILKSEKEIAAAALTYKDSKSALFLGRGVGVSIAIEGALKLKEVSYLHAEGYPAGEMKHGPLAIVEPAVPVVFIATASRTYEKTLNNMKEASARDARVIAVATAGDETTKLHAESVFYVPKTSELLSAIPAVIPLQVFAYYISIARGNNPDRPRNLAKAVTVE